MQTKDESKDFSLLEIRDLSVKLGGNQILDDVNFDVTRGQIHALIGPNGAGKTTLIRSIMGGMPHTGTIRFLFRENGKIGYVPQLLEFDHSVPITVCDFVAMMLQRTPVFLNGGRGKREKIKQLLSVTESDKLIDRMVGGLSGGEFRRVLLAQALEPLPELLLLDEPASNIDEYGARAFEEMLISLKAEHGLSIIIVGHDIKMILRCADRVTSINRGVTFDGPPDELSHPDKVAQLFGLVTTSTDSEE